MTRIFILTLLPTQIIFSFLWCTDSPNAAFSHKREFLFEKKNLHSSSPFRTIWFFFFSCMPSDSYCQKQFKLFNYDTMCLHYINISTLCWLYKSSIVHVKIILILFTGNTTNLQWHIDHDHNLNNQPEKAGRQPKSDQRTGPVFRSGRPSHVQSKITPSMIMIESRISSARQACIDEALMKLLVGKVLPLSLVDHPLFQF
jgi:hypothetical protein